MSHRPVNVALVGLGFGAEFIPIYQAHPDAHLHSICCRDDQRRNAIGDEFGIDGRYGEFLDLIEDPDVDAVHLNTPIPDHAWMSVRALEAGKHVFCTVPMATSVADCERICDAVHASGLVYMMAETVVFSREYLHIKELYQHGQLGRLQYLQASHPQDMTGWPLYWEEMVPMHYATHVVSPILGLVDGRAERVTCLGSGRVNDHIRQRSGSPFAVESCQIAIKDSDVAGHIWRALFDTARQYRESFDVYGSERSFEWTLTEDQPHVLHVRGREEHEIPEPVTVPDYAHLLPEPLRPFTQQIHDDAHRSFVQGGGHGGSHPHLAHAFVQAIRGEGPVWPDAHTAANWTCVGICAHESALQGGKPIDLPAFTLEEIAAPASTRA